MDSYINIARESEFYQGYIRFKMSVSNESPYVITEITLDFIFDENLLHIADHDNCPVRNGKFNLGIVHGGKSKTFTILFEPLTCTKAADIRCQINYADHEGRMNSLWMEPKEISVTCPIMKTDQDINIGRLKEFIEKLPNSDSRVYEVQNGFDVKKLSILAREVVERHDVRHISTLHTRDGNACEIWYYGRTKVTKDDIVIKISILAEHSTMELFAATRNSEALAGLLAEVGRDLKEIVEDKASGIGRVVNVHIKDSLIQRSNLLDMCDMDGTCDINVVIEDSLIQRSNIATVNEETARLKAAEEAEKKRKAEEERRLKAEERLRDENEEAERKRKEVKKQQTAKQAPVSSQTTPVSKSQKPVSPLVKRRDSSQKEQKSGQNKLLIPMLLVLLLGGIWLTMPESNDNSDTIYVQEPVQSNENPAIVNPENPTDKKDDSISDISENSIDENDYKSEAVVSSSNIPKTYTNTIGMEFTLIPAGEFMMGSNDGLYRETPVHEVTIGQAYYLGKYEVTQEQWIEIMGDNPSYFDGKTNPVESISWLDVQEFVKKLNEKEGMDKYRLPSEAEWEYACRAGTTTAYSFGDSESDLSDYAWAAYVDYSGPRPVGTKKPNPWGLYDMHGNVWEWCQDSYYDSYLEGYKGAPVDGTAWEGNSNYRSFARGGSFHTTAEGCRSAFRVLFSSGDGDETLGFRLIMDV
ncbi:SUMF1/EgtB/PvdO family nonheme iron enzyme [Methanococcoides sp. AM1]|uniref:SUMF1/EgtB/PvdO family nonheme iron enzyme n=1 Tax=Methanococcoides sp. AM1 TaxID=1201011 RepID=UPI001FCEA3AC|nr:SUMF1/EgtB/PvdO family nonheme iron enzyme [Methanococcoides sp. AM1]